MDTSSSTAQMSCGICLEVVMEKPKINDRFFCLLPNCMHCFCFTCIKQWRKNTHVAENASKSCPECRTMAAYVYRSKIWFHDKNKKKSFINKQNNQMKKIDCRLFKKGRGRCHFGNSCLYRHLPCYGVKLDLRSSNSNRDMSPLNVSPSWWSLIYDSDSDSSDDFPYNTERWIVYYVPNYDEL